MPMLLCHQTYEFETLSILYGYVHMFYLVKIAFSK